MCFVCKLLCFGLLSAAVGCSQPTVAPIATCKVTADGSPVIGLQITVHGEASKQALSESSLLIGNTDSSGLAVLRFAPGVNSETVPSGDLSVTIESLGDGDWQIASPWNDASKTPLRLSWPPQSDVVELKIPRKAIKPL